jgi:hypothetical protein
MISGSISQTEYERIEMFNRVSDAVPKASAPQLAAALRDENLKAALEARRKRMHDEHSSFPSAGSVLKAASPASSADKDLPLSLLRLGTDKSVSPLSLRAQPKTDAPLTEKSNPLSLAKEERAPMFAATKQVSPSASSKENNYLAGFMRSPVEPQLDEQAQQALDKEPFFSHLPH